VAPTSALLAQDIGIRVCIGGLEMFSEPEFTARIRTLVVRYEGPRLRNRHLKMLRARYDRFQMGDRFENQAD
jgi:hypothetical protein